MNRTMYAYPAYGRTSASLAEWYDGKDFRSISGPYFSIRDIDYLKALGYSHVVVCNNPHDVAFTVVL